MGGCDCICECECHADPTTDPCYTFPRLDCPVCIAAEKAWEEEMDKEEAEELKAYNEGLPSDAEIRRVFR